MRLHATCVAVEGHGVLILGASGSGKSSLALELMAFGAQLVADDQTIIENVGGLPVASAPDVTLGAVEARGVGLLAAKPAGPTVVTLVIDLDQIETKRLPPERAMTLHGQIIPLLHKLERPYFPAAILQYIKAGRAQL